MVQLEMAGLPPIQWREILNPIKLGLEGFLDVADRFDEVHALIVNNSYEEVPQVVRWRKAEVERTSTRQGS